MTMKLSLPGSAGTVTGSMSARHPMNAISPIARVSSVATPSRRPRTLGQPLSAPKGASTTPRVHRS